MIKLFKLVFFLPFSLGSFLRYSSLSWFCIKKCSKCFMLFFNGFRRLFFRRSLPVPTSGTRSKAYGLTPKEHCSGKPSWDAFGVWVAGNPAPPSARRKTFVGSAGRERGFCGSFACPLSGYFFLPKKYPFETALRDAHSPPFALRGLRERTFSFEKVLPCPLRAQGFAPAPNPYRFPL